MTIAYYQPCFRKSFWFYYHETDSSMPKENSPKDAILTSSKTGRSYNTTQTIIVIVDKSLQLCHMADLVNITGKLISEMP